MANMTIISNRPGLLKLLIALLAGVSTSFAFAPYHIVPVVVISISILFFLWNNSTSIKHSFFYGYAFGFGLFGVGVSWLQISINLFGGMNLFGSYIATYALVAVLSLFPAFVGTLHKAYFKSSNFFNCLLVLPCLWTLLEWVRSWIFTGLPWLSLGYTQTDTVLSAYAPLLGVYGISFLLCLISACLNRIILAHGLQKLYALIILCVIGLTGFQLNPVEWTHAQDKPLAVALVQAAIPQEIKWLPEQAEKTIQLHKDLSEDHWGKDIIVWPETALPLFYHHALPLINELTERAKQENTQLILGIAYKDREQRRYYNSVINIGFDKSRYDKQHLVPFGEYLPIDHLLGPLFDGLGISISDFSIGPENTPLFKAGNNYLGVSICYEDIFGEQIIKALPKANLLINVSNDAWFGDSAAPHQHLQMARMRSIETQRPMLRSTNTGISAIIDHKGKIIHQSPQFKAHALSGQVVPRIGVTPYAQTGNGFIVIVLFGILFLCYVSNRKPFLLISR